jgi:hypothetical protein
MTSERIQLHSSSGRLVLLAFGLMPLTGLSGVVVAAVLAVLRPGTVHVPMPSIILGCLVVVLARWAYRNSTCVFASPQGIELPERKRTIPWPSVVKAYSVPFIGGGIPTIHRLTFNDGTPPLTFYSQGEPEQIVRRFKLAAAA